MNQYQEEIAVSVDQLVAKDHKYRLFKKLVDFDRLIAVMKLPENIMGPNGFGNNRLVMCILLEFIEDLSFRCHDRFLKENVAAKWFCGFGLLEKTPDYSTLSKFVTKVGLERLQKLFEEMRRQLKQAGYLMEELTFIDASALISKLQMWEERDNAIKDGEEKLNNKNIQKYTSDKDVRIGAKSKKKFWVGFKRNRSVDMKSRMINKVSVTYANVPDGQAGEEVLPDKGSVFGDKGYVPLIPKIRQKGLLPRVILKDNMKDKNVRKDKIISRKRCPHEATFTRTRNRTRFRGLEKNNMIEILLAFGVNMNRWVVLAG